MMRVGTWIARRWTRLVSPPLTIALLLATPGVVFLTSCSYKPAVVPAASAGKTAPKLPPRVPTAAEDLSRSLGELKTTLSGVKDVAAARTKLGAASKRLASLDTSMHAEFAKTREILKKVDSNEKDALQDKFERDYATKMGKLTDGLTKLASVEDTAAYVKQAKALGSWLASMDPQPKRQALGTTQLPHRIVDYKAGPPVLGTSIAPAYALNLPDSIPSTLPKTPTAEDLTETIEVQFTPEIRSLATSLGNDPVKMYEWVRNNIDFEPYYGSRKGAAETLAEMSGNDMDTASLLIALYRVSGIPARYVQGVVDVPIDRAMNWVGVETPEAAGKLFSAGGVPTAIITSGGKPRDLRIEHCWTEVCVPYEDYRGLGDGSGRKRWIPLDGSWKRYSRDKMPSLGLDAVDWVPNPERGTTTAAASEIESLTAAVKAHLSDNTTEAASLLLGDSSIVSESLGLLPPALGYVSQPASELRALLGEDRFSVRLALGTGESAWTSPLGEAANKRMWVEYEPTSADDQELLEVAGSPPYLISVKPALVVDDAKVLVGPPVGLGQASDIHLRIGSGRAGFETINKTVVGGERSALTVRAGRVSVARLRSASALLADASRSIRTDMPMSRVLGAILDAHGLEYFAQCQVIRSLGTFASGVTAVQGMGAAFSDAACDVSTVFGVPGEVRVVGFNLDVQCDEKSAVAASHEALVDWSLADGLVDSGAEHMVLQGSYGGPAVSTARVLSVAAQHAIPIRMLASPGDVDAGLAAALPTEVRESVTAALAQGYRVEIPEQAVTIGGWTGWGWIQSDPDSGSAAFMISDGLAGSFMDFLSAGMSAATGFVSGAYRYNDALARWQEVWSGRTATTYTCEVANYLCTAGAAMVAGLAQLVQDSESDYAMSLTTQQEVSRVIVAFVVNYIAIRIAGAGVKAIAVAKKDARYFIAGQMAVSVGCSALWTMLKRQLYTALQLEPNRPADMPVPTDTWPDYFNDFDGDNPLPYC